MIEKRVATVQILLDTDNDAEACDMLSALLSDHGFPFGVIDWGYLKHGGQHLYPSEKLIPEDYEEGWCFR